MKIRDMVFVLIAVIFAVGNITAQMVSPVKWKIRLDKTSEKEGVVVFDATIDKGWHLYSTTMPEGGPTPTTFTWEELENVELVGDITPDRAPHEELDMMFELTLGWWSDAVSLKQKVKFTDPKNYKISGYLNYMACNDQTCQAPQTENFEFKEGKIDAATANTVVDKTTQGQSGPENQVAVGENQPQNQADTVAPITAAVTTVAQQDVTTGQNMANNSYWTPIEFDSVSEDTSSENSLWYIFIGGFVGGLLALLTPCVWPMIPLTVSFFLKKHGSRKRSIIDAIIYGCSIIVIYLVLGLIITLIFGPSKLNDLATNAVFNIIFFLLLVVFAISFFGAFDITLPSKWTNSMDAKASRTSGLLSIFFMAFTLTLVSFSCTGPIIGTLLVEAVSMGDLTGPAVGMGAFALALAIPFTIFAIFPSWMQDLPKSGGWLNSVKVVLGFCELALSLKFLSVADLAYGWGLLDREVFVSLWIVMFALLGLYLLGKLRFPHDSKVEKVSVFRFFAALVSFAFAVYLLPGLWGAPLKSVSAFVPPLSTQDFNLYEEAEFVKYDDYNIGMNAAKDLKRPVFVDFSGYGCVNCRKMEAAVFDNPEIRRLIEENFVMITLMVDDKKSLAETIEVDENGKTTKLRTYGDLWSYLQRYKFGANSQPYYVVLDNEGNLLSGPVYYDENVGKFADFLQKGMENYKK